MQGLLKAPSGEHLRFAPRDIDLCRTAGCGCVLEAVPNLPTDHDVVETDPSAAETNLRIGNPRPHDLTG